MHIIFMAHVHFDSKFQKPAAHLAHIAPIKIDHDIFTITNSLPFMNGHLAAIQRASFPTLAADHLITEDHFKTHIEKFPQGQHAVVNKDGIPVASSSDLRTSLDFSNFQHRYIDMVDHNWIGTHDPDGDWLYGFDIGVMPSCRGLGLSRLLYDARKALVKHLNLKGHVAGGMLKGYGAYKDKMSAADYAQKVAAGDIFDPTLSVQLKRGFSIAGILDDYLDDPSCDNKAALIVWHNPEYKPA